MLPVWKRGATVRILLDQFTPEEWAAITPWTSIMAHGRGAGRVLPMVVRVDEAERVLEVSADSRGWPLGVIQADVCVVLNGAPVYLPPAGYLAFEIIDSAGGCA